MGQPLDAIVKKDLLGTRDDDGTNNFVSINVSDFTDSHDISGSEQGGTLTIIYDNGVGNDIDFQVEGSADGINFAGLTDTNASQNISDASGTVIFDLININANFIRVAYTVNSGSADIYVFSSFKRRH
jgi:hypothetical protein